MNPNRKGQAMDATQQEVWAAVQKMNRLWTVENDTPGLKDFFHARMTALTPVGRERLEGGMACVAGWKSFTDKCKVLFWKELDPRVEIFGDGAFAVVSYYYDMAFETGGSKVKTQGRDIFALVKEDGRWQAVMDQFSPYPF